MSLLVYSVSCIFVCLYTSSLEYFKLYCTILYCVCVFCLLGGLFSFLCHLDSAYYWRNYFVTQDSFKIFFQQGLAHAYENLAKAYRKVVEVMASGKRLLGKYFRVAFFGQTFGDDDGKEYVYKEPKITSLSEISHRMEEMYSRKYGRDTIKLILESSKVHFNVLKFTSAIFPFVNSQCHL